MAAWIVDPHGRLADATSVLYDLFCVPSLDYRGLEADRDDAGAGDGHDATPAIPESSAPAVNKIRDAEEAL